MIFNIKTFYLILIFYFVLFFCSCTKGKLKDITIKDGFYVYYRNNELANGFFLDYFQNSSKVSCSFNLKNGIPIGEYTSYGYQGEVIATSKYSPIGSNVGDDFNKLNIVRITITDSKEGDYKFLDLNIVFKSKPTLDYTQLATNIFDILKKRNLDINKFETIYFRLGELERSFFEIKTSGIGK